MFKKLILASLFGGSIMSAKAQVDHWETIVYDNSTWSYTVPTASTATNWISPTFDASAWSTGSGGFGFGDGDDNTSLPTGTIAVYQRISFNISNLSAIQKFILNMDYDDGFVAYLNGVEIARNGLSGTGQPTYNQLASISHEAQLYQGNYPDQFMFNTAQVATYLVTGNNVLCIETHNQTGTSSDLTSRAFLSAGIGNSTTYFGAPPTWFNAPVDLVSSNLPIVVLNTNGITIPDEPKIDADMGIIYNGPGVTNHITDPFNEFNGQIGIESRGSSSQGFPQKSWGLETRFVDSSNMNVSIFDWPADNDWILYAPYTDKTFLRNVLTYHIGNEMGKWAPRTQLCEVVLNGEYQGVYVFMERIKQNPGRVGIDQLNYYDTLNNELTGGYILKVDKTTAGGIIAWTSPYDAAAPSTINIQFQMHDPEITEMHPTQLSYIQNYVTNWEAALIGSNFMDPVSGYRPYIDVESFIDFFLVNEFTKNVDGYRISSFLYKERFSEGGKLNAGPLWDFNLGLGNADYCQGGTTTGWEINFNSYCGGGLDNPFWWGRLLQDSTYANEVNCRWFTLRQGVLSNTNLHNYIDSLAAVCATPATRNFAKWPILGTYVWPNNFIGNTYQEEIDYMKTWIDDRLTWMDANMYGHCSNLSVPEIEVSPIAIFPNPANTVVNFYSEKLNHEEVTIGLYGSDGSMIQSHTTNDLAAFSLHIEQLSNGIYYLQFAAPNAAIQTIKLIKQ
jgi:hypothetical protein